MTQQTADPMDLTGMERPALEQYAQNLHDALENAEAERARLLVDNGAVRAELAALRNALADLTEHVFDAAQAAAHAAQLGRMLTNDQGEPE